MSIPRSGLLAAAVVVAVASALDPTPGAAQARPDSSASDRAVGVTGWVKERDTEVPVMGADVVLRPSTGTGIAAAAETGEEGGFDLGMVSPGTYVIEITRIGYTTLSDTVGFVDGPPAVLSVFLTPEAIDLEPITVIVDQTTNPILQGFERRRALGIGAFITRDDIERRHPTKVSDLFRSVPSVHVTTSPRTGDGILTMRGGCRPGIVIDGAPVSSGVSLDMTMSPQDVEAIEIYGLANAPVQYSRSQCGTIMVWTRVTQRTAGDGHPWRMAAFIGGIIAALVLIR
ncbi:MAG: TonB-dependent receptor plug domain-containing protein [Gemmatimonadota bacterium]|jgi:hypothetical protein